MISKVFSVIFIVIHTKIGFFITPAIILITLCLDYEQIGQLTDSDFIRNYGTLFLEFDSSSIFKLFYYVVMSSRNIIFTLSQLYLSQYEYAQKTVNLASSILLLVFLIFIKPFKEKVTLFSNIVTEVLTSLVFALLVLKNLLLEDFYFDISFISIISVSILFQLLLSCILICNKLIVLWKRYRSSNS